MEKLIELLRERKPNFDENHILDMMYSEGIILIKDGKPIYVYDSISPNIERMIINGKIGFIKRLLDNNKININDEWNDYEETNLYCNSDFFQLQKHYSYYESLLMLLAIQDNPTEFLISVLK